MPKLRKKFPIIRMPSSMIQQNHGENVNGHGYSVWDMKTSKYEHVEIPNDYSHHTIDIDNGEIITDLTSLPKYPNLRIKIKNSQASDVKSKVTEIRKVCEPIEISYIKSGDDELIDDNINPSVDIDQISDVEYQNELIKEYLIEKVPTITEDTLEDVCELNKTLNGELKKLPSDGLGIKWIPKKFEFSNMFSYGEDNVIDFTQLKDIIGIFGDNYSGKSSIFSAFTYCLFDKCDKAFKANQVMNLDKNEMSMKLTFEINSIEYVIERVGKRDKKGNVPLPVTFKKKVDGEYIDLSGEDKDSTNEIIRKYVGSYDDFCLTTLSTVGSKSKNIIDMGQSDRKDLLTRFMGIDIFDRLASIASEKSKDVNAKLRTFQKDLFEKNLALLETESEARQDKTIDLENRINSTSTHIDQLQFEIVQKNKLMSVIKSDIPTDIDSLNSRRATLVSMISDSTTKSEMIKNKLQEIDAQIEIAENLLLDSKFSDISNRYIDNNKKKSSLSKVDSEIQNMKFVVKNKLEKLKHLSEHEYDPNCKFCCNNIFVKDAISTKDSLENYKQNVIKLIENKKSIELEIDSNIEVNYKEFTELNNSLNQLNQNKSKLSSLLVGIQNNDYAIELKNVDMKIDLYNESKEIIKNNIEIENDIRELERQLKNSKFEKTKLEKEAIENTSRLRSVKDQILSITERIEIAVAAEKECLAYQLYQTAVGKNGVPYKMVSSILPSIEKEVNNVLSQMCDFTLKLESEGKDINIYISHSDKCWPIELCSGMEKFTSSLALRIGLVNVSNLPHPPIVIIDEGFGTMTKKNASMLPVLFAYLKNQFDSVFIISHLDQIRDYVNSSITIKKDSIFSTISYK